MTSVKPIVHGLPDDAERTVPSSRRSRRRPAEGATPEEQLIDRLRELGWTAAVAESLTGGMLAAALIAVPGASDVVRGGVVAYATDVKHSLLGVDQTLLDAHGAVHPRVARQMAEGVRVRLGYSDEPCDVGIATTGIAGPDSPDGQPVGTVHIAVSTPLGTRLESLELRGTREQIRADATRHAIRLAREAL